MNPKQCAADAALSYVKNGMVVGLGTGSTADYFLQALGNALKSGKLTGIRGVPTSLQSHRRAQELHIPLATLLECPNPDVTIDGADEIDPQMNLIKGLGGALLREKIVAQNSRKLVIIADQSKVVTRLGEKSPLPVEVTIFGHEIQKSFLRSLGAEPTLRRDPVGKVFVTDNGNHIYDCRFASSFDAIGTESRLKSRAGIVETGLFLNIAQIVVIGNDQIAEIRSRS